MTTYRNGQPRPTPKLRGEPPASGFQLWTWAANPPPRELPRPWTLKAWRQQSRVAAAWAHHEAELNAREDECLRMFGITVDYFMDERVIHHGA